MSGRRTSGSRAGAADFNGRSTITAGGFVGLPGAYSVAGVGNYDGDTHSDILLRNQATGDVGMWLMNGTAITSGSFVGALSPSFEIR